MYQVKGVVDNCHTKTKTSKAGRNFTIHYITVDGVEISTGFKQEHSEGEAINIGVEKKFNEWQKASNAGDGLPPLPSGGSQEPTPIRRGSFSGNRGTFPVETTDGQMSIIRQSSMNRAVEIMQQLLHHGIFEAETEEQYMHKLMEIALIVTDFGSGQDIMQLKAAQNANKAVNQ